MKTLLGIAFALISGVSHGARTQTEPRAQTYEYKETRELVSLVNDAAKMVEKKGEASFQELSRPGTKWRQKDAYVFVLDPKGNMLVHPDPKLKDHNTLDLKDVNGRPIIKGLIEAATETPKKPEGWYHYQWPEPGDIAPRWKSSFVRRVKTPDGKELIVGSGVYNERMEKAFVKDMVKDAVGQIEQKGTGAFPLFRDPTGRFMAKDAYVFVIDEKGVEVVNPAHPNFEGRYVLDTKDVHGKTLSLNMYNIAKNQGAGWESYMWPRPGESVPTEKTTYVERAKIGDKWYVVGAGVYLTGAPRAEKAVSELTAPQLQKLVRDAAALVEKQGEKAYAEFRKKGSKWFKGDTYFFVWNMDGTRVLHAADPSLEGKNGSNEKDIQGRPYGQMFLNVAKTPQGEGWAHYMYPFPGHLFPAWKSAFLKKVTLPDGKQQLIGSASYHMQMTEDLIEDLVDRASELVKEKGEAAFAELRDKKGPYFFMDTYVFVDTPQGDELVNPGTPYLEGKNIFKLKDAKGKTIARDYIEIAMAKGSAWHEYHWYKPGSNEPTLKRAFVRKVQSGDNTYIVGSGYYVDEGSRMAQEAPADESRD